MTYNLGQMEYHLPNTFLSISNATSPYYLIVTQVSGLGNLELAKMVHVPLICSHPHGLEGLLAEVINVQIIYGSDE